jgi:hypothetical protein
MATRVKVILKKVNVKKNGRLIGRARWLLFAQADGKAFGDSTEVFKVKSGAEIELPESPWNAIATVTRAGTLEVKLEAREKARFSPDDFGSVRRVLRWPFSQGDFVLENAFFRARFSLELEARGEFKRHDPREVFACRETAGNPRFTTVTGVEQRARFEACEVRPTPPVSYLPSRIAGLAGEICFKSDKGLAISDTSPLNVLPNPPVIPIMLPKDASKTTAARIEMNFYQPKTLALAEDDDRLEWEIVTGDANAKILGSNKGMGVYVYGIAEGDVVLELRFLGAKIASYRAIVKDPQVVQCRVNLLDGGAGFRTSASDSDVEKHFLAANRILRQVALSLVLVDDGTDPSDGAVRIKDGIFRIPLPRRRRGLARNLSGNFPAATRLNRRLEVLNVYYVVSMADASVLGESVARPINSSPVPAGGSFPQLTDTGTPASSWIDPSGVHPHAAATAKTIEMMNPGLDTRIRRRDRDKHWSLTVCNGNSSILQYANTLAHEVCHALGLAHREPSQDLLPELDENLMHATEGPSVAQDLDILQAKAVHNSPIVTDPIAPGPGPTPGPPKPGPKTEGKPVPAAWTPKAEDVALLQAYLVGKRPGLRNSGYDLGPFGPDADGVDGKYGNRTKQAVRDWQRAHGGIGIDGLFGPESQGAMDEELNGETPP